MAEHYFARELEELSLLASSPLSRTANGYERGYIVLKPGLWMRRDSLLFALRAEYLAEETGTEEEKTDGRENSLRLGGG